MKVTLTLAALLITGSASTAYADNPNVLFIAIDDLNDWVGCFGGNPQVKTPNLDTFAAEGGIVMLWGDHGWFLGEKQRYGKTFLWQESCRVPLMVKVPAVTPKNRKCMGVVNLIDMYPTLVELCGLPENPVIGGRSFVPLLRNPQMKWNYPTMTNGCSPGFYRIYDGRYSYISHRQRRAEELYDHHQDPMEWTNLASNPEYAEIKARLKPLVPQTDAPRSPENPDP